MPTRSVKLSQEDANSLAKIDESIQARSIELGRMTIAKREMESGLTHLYEFRNTLIRKALKSQGIDQDRLHVRVIGKDELAVAMEEESPEVAEEPNTEHRDS